jgi:hypothetical protein
MTPEDLGSDSGTFNRIRRFGTQKAQCSTGNAGLMDELRRLRDAWCPDRWAEASASFLPPPVMQDGGGAMRYLLPATRGASA